MLNAFVTLAVAIDDDDFNTLVAFNDLNITVNVTGIAGVTDVAFDNRNVFGGVIGVRTTGDANGFITSVFGALTDAAGTRVVIFVIVTGIVHPVLTAVVATSANASVTFATAVTAAVAVAAAVAVTAAVAAAVAVTGAVNTSSDSGNAQSWSLGRALVGRLFGLRIDSVAVLGVIL